MVDRRGFMRRRGRMSIAQICTFRVSICISLLVHHIHTRVGLDVGPSFFPWSSLLTDMAIVMAFVTYILLSTLLAGVRGAFHPELLGLTATTAFAVVIFEILGLKLGTYLLSISSESQLLDLVAYSGYKFVGIIVTLLLSEILNRTSLGSGGGGTGGWIGWGVFLYVFAANAFFLLRSLRYVLLPDMAQGGGGTSAASYTVARSQRNRRTQFLFVYSYVVQFVFMWLLSRQSADPKGVKV